MWLRDKVLPLTGNYEDGDARSIIVLDNARIHQYAREIIESESNARCIYLPPYSPDLNPIELMFHSYKQGLKKHIGKGRHIAHRLALQSVTPVIARSYFKKSQVPRCDHYLSKAIVEEEEKDDEMLAVCSILMNNTLMTAATSYATIRNKKNK